MSVKLLLTALLAAFCSVGGSVAFAETTEDVRQRMELYRKREEDAETKKAERAAEDAARRQKTRLWQEERRAEEYARTWKRYGNDEVNVLSWRQHKDGSWVADAKGGMNWCDPGFCESSTQRPRIPQVELIGVNCISLQVNRKPKFDNWGKWIRPEPFSTDEQLVIDRCATSSTQAQLLVGANPQALGAVDEAVSISKAAAPSIISTGSLLAWRVNSWGGLELRTEPDIRPQAFFEAGTGLRGPRVWIDLPGTPGRARTVPGSGVLREVRIGRPNGFTTRLILEFAPGIKLDPGSLQLKGTTRDRWRLYLSGIMGLGIKWPEIGEGEL